MLSITHGGLSDLCRHIQAGMYVCMYLHVCMVMVERLVSAYTSRYVCMYLHVCIVMVERLVSAYTSMYGCMDVCLYVRVFMYMYV